LGVTGEQKSGLSSGTEEEQLRKRQWPLTRLGQFGDVLAFVLVGDFENSHLTQTLLAGNIKKYDVKTRSGIYGNTYSLGFNCSRSGPFTLVFST
jgi:hypothetical protein